MLRVAAGLALFLAACGLAPVGPAAPPTEAEALEHLGAVVAIVESGDISRICELGTGTCVQMLRDADLVAVPRTGPVVTGTRVVPPKTNPDGTWTDGGIVLEMCGLNGLGEPYDSEMLVMQWDGRIASIGTLYWLGTRIASGPTTELPRPSPRSCPGIGGG